MEFLEHNSLNANLLLNAHLFAWTRWKCGHCCARWWPNQKSKEWDFGTIFLALLEHARDCLHFNVHPFCCCLFGFLNFGFDAFGQLLVVLPICCCQNGQPENQGILLSIAPQCSVDNFVSRLIGLLNCLLRNWLQWNPRMMLQMTAVVDVCNNVQQSIQHQAGSIGSKQLFSEIIYRLWACFDSRLCKWQKWMNGLVNGGCKQFLGIKLSIMEGWHGPCCYLWINVRFYLKD